MNFERIVLLDGGFGTELQAAGLARGEDPTDWNLEHPEAVRAVHRAYVEAGSEIILANTFGANALKYRGGYPLDELIAAAVGNARAAGARTVALDIGPSGRLLKPVGDLDFDAAYAAYAEMVRSGVAAGADLVFIETMGDLREMKAAVIAAKENSALSVWATATLGENGEFLTGGSVEELAIVMEALGVEAYGLNCGLGPGQLLPYFRRLAALARRPLIVKPNAGMPHLEGERTVFSVGPEKFADDMAELVAAGAGVIGGCCGTTPRHLAALSAAGFRKTPCSARPQETAVASGSRHLALTPHAGVIIGERINPTGKRRLREAYQSGDVAYVLREAVAEVEQGAVAIDINCGVPGLDERAVMERTLAAVESVVTVPIQIDTADVRTLESALRRVNGKALVNSVNGKRESLATVLPLVRRYGGVVVALCLDEQGIPPTVEGRLAIARRILAEGAKYGFTPADFVFDALTLAVSADDQAASVTLETVRRLTDELGVNTVLGVSNVSFGLPNRPALNAAMYELATQAGLSAAIFNPSAPRKCASAEEFAAAKAVLTGGDPHCEAWIRRHADWAPAPSAAIAETVSEAALSQAVVRGLGEDARALARQLVAAGVAPLKAIDEGIVPALEEVGRGFEAGRLYLPQLLMSADAAGAAFEALRSALARDGGAATKGRPIVVATVKGDIHDIGKNIVRALLENYGFSVIDLGRDVAPAEIVAAARRSRAMLVGLSALMTTTVGAMAETIRELRAAGVTAKVCVGGAVVTEEYARSIGADYYAKDAMRTVRIAESLVDSQG